MGRKILSFLLIFICLSMAGCRQSPVTPTNGSTGATQFRTEGTQHTDATEYTDTTEHTEETLAPEPPPPDAVPEDAGSEWIPICENYISLWADTNANKRIATVAKGETLILQAWQGKFALVTYNDMEGYVYSNRIQPKETDYFTKHLQVLKPTTRYTYEQMQADSVKLRDLYPTLVTLSFIGESEYGVDIPVIRIGNGNAKYQVLIQAAIHGREHFTAWLAMALIDYTLYTNQLNKDVCYHIIPMTNPDGVRVSQSGQLDEEQEKVYWADLYFETTRPDMYEYAVQWKANGLGVDLNRNFPSGWAESNARTETSSEEYRGEAPFVAKETIALRDYTLSCDFDVTISLHSHGSVLYYKYGKKQPVNDLSYDLALAVQKVTGYVPTAFDNTTGAGYKDWVMDELGIPSLTVEIGNFETPMQNADIYNTFDRCKTLLPTIYDWITQQ